MYNKERKKYYTSLDIRNITDDKKFWRTVKQFLSDKGPKTQNITLIKNNCIISKYQDVSETLNNFFKSTVDSFNLSENKYVLTNIGGLIAVKKIENHPSIFDIKENVTTSNLYFSEISISDIEIEVKT